MFETQLPKAVATAAVTATLVLAGCGAAPTQSTEPAPDNTVEVTSSMSDQSLDTAEKALSAGTPKSYAELKEALFGTEDIISSEMYNAPVYVEATAVMTDSASATDPAKIYQAAAVEDLCLAVQLTESLRESASTSTEQNYQMAYDKLAAMSPETLMQTRAADLGIDEPASDDVIKLDQEGTKLCMDEIASMAKTAGFEIGAKKTE